MPAQVAAPRARQRGTLVVYPGSFDPITLGHLDVAARAATLFDRVVLAVARNADKAGRYLFDDAARARLAAASLAHLPGVEVAVVPGLLADYCRQVGATAIVKGLRTGADLDAEVPMALINRQLVGIETVFLVADPAHAHVSSSLAKDVARHGGDVSNLVPAPVAQALRTTLGAGAQPLHG